MNNYDIIVLDILPMFIFLLFLLVLCSSSHFVSLAFLLWKIVKYVNIQKVQNFGLSPLGIPLIYIQKLLIEIIKVVLWRRVLHLKHLLRCSEQLHILLHSKYCALFQDLLRTTNDNLISHFSLTCIDTLCTIWKASCKSYLLQELAAIHVRTRQ